MDWNGESLPCNEIRGELFRGELFREELDFQPVVNNDMAQNCTTLKLTVKIQNCVQNCVLCSLSVLCTKTIIQSFLEPNSKVRIHILPVCYLLFNIRWTKSTTSTLKGALPNECPALIAVVNKNSNSQACLN